MTTAGLQPGVVELAQALLGVRASAGLMVPPSDSSASFDLDAGYAVATETARQREAAGGQRCGYKLGFTNRTIWPRYGVYAPIWAPVWDDTVTLLDNDNRCEISLHGLVQPRLEPEIVFGFARSPGEDLSAEALWACLDWVAHGFEIVHTHYADWRFAAADAVADFGLHGRLIVGPQQAVAAFGSARGLQQATRDLQLSLLCNGLLVENGTGSVVLDGPLDALAYGLAALRRQTPQWSVKAGDVITTGTLTDAAPVEPGQIWHTQLSGQRLPGLTLALTG